MRFNEDWSYQFTLANNFCLLELIWVALGHLDELQKAEKYPIRWSLQAGFTVWPIAHQLWGSWRVVKDNSHDSQIPIGIAASGSRDW